MQKVNQTESWKTSGPEVNTFITESEPSTVADSFTISGSFLQKKYGGKYRRISTPDPVSQASKERVRNRLRRGTITGVNDKNIYLSAQWMERWMNVEAKTKNRAMEWTAWRARGRRHVKGNKDSQSRPDWSAAINDGVACHQRQPVFKTCNVCNHT